MLLLGAGIVLALAACASGPPVRPTALPTQRPLATAAPSVAPATPTPATARLWPSPQQVAWQWQLSGLPVDQSVEADLYDIDGFENDAAVVAALHAKGRVVICYLSAGTWEDWRPDAERYPASALGRQVDGWPNERWLDIRQIDALAPIVERRMDLCKQRGFDGVEPDNVDGYANDTGFPLTYQDQIAFNTFLARAARARGLAVGLKNDLGQVADLVDLFDFAINEQCFQEDDCELLLPFVRANKPVFHVEYRLAPDDFCARAGAMGFNSIKKHRSLDAYRETCR